MSRHAYLSIALLAACAPQTARPTAYGVELAACSDAAKTLTESLVCENQVRARYGRPLRDAGVE